MLEVRRSRDRGYADHGWLRSYYTFSFADYYDPEHVDFGPLQVMNEDRVRAGRGYGAQERREVAVLIWLIAGELEHQDSLGNQARLQANSLQYICGGTGVTHTETNPSPLEEAHLLTICLRPPTAGLPPAYRHKHFPQQEQRGTLRLIASPEGESGSVALQQETRLYAGHLHDSQQAALEIEKSRRAFVHVVRGSIAVNEVRLNAGDGVKVTPPGEVMLQYGREADVVVFDLPAGVVPPTGKPAAGRPRKAVKVSR